MYMSISISALYNLKLTRYVWVDGFACLCINFRHGCTSLSSRLEVLCDGQVLEYVSW